jgi:5-(carboxyamino)imidazole ribonucleotide mutase
MESKTPKVGIIMGSDSDFPHMKEAAECLFEFGVPFEIKVISAHRTPSEMAEYGKAATQRGLRVIIAGAGGAAHLPGMMAAFSELPVIGVPVPHGPLQGQDALYSIVQMPKGVPVATVAIGNSFNAGLLAAQILAYGGGKIDLELADRLKKYKLDSRESSLKKTVSFLPDN